MARGNDELGKRKRAEERVENSDGITDAERDAILALYRHELNDKKDSTVRSHTNQLRLFAERSDADMTEMSVRDVQDVLDAMRSGDHPEVKDDGIGVANYQTSLRVFYDYHDFGFDHEAIEIDDVEGRDLSPEDLLYKDDVDAFLRSARRASTRDAAFIALGLATGQRLDALRTLRLKHVKTDGPTMEIELNTNEGNLKGADGTKPVLWAKHWLRQWLEIHPHKDDDDAALWVSIGNGYEAARESPGEPVSDDTCGRIVRKAADRAGLDKDVYPHLLRHTAITRMVTEGLSEQQIKQLVGWKKDSSQFETYVSLADDLNNDAVRETLGLPTSKSGVPDIGRPSLERCPSCNDQLPGDTERCPTCHSPLTDREAERDDAEPEPAPTVTIESTIKEAVMDMHDDVNEAAVEAQAGTAADAITDAINDAIATINPDPEPAPDGMTDDDE